MVMFIGMWLGVLGHNIFRNSWLQFTEYIAYVYLCRGQWAMYSGHTWINAYSRKPDLTHAVNFNCTTPLALYHLCTGHPRLLSLAAFHTASDKSLGWPGYEANILYCVLMPSRGRIMRAASS